ncbi:MAG TPA: VIT1/CCC1 transporter family protein [Candidatus Methanoperedens sp.]
MLHRIKRFSEIYLTPAERLSEIIFGLIMVLTVTSTLKIALTGGDAEIKMMIIAAIGCNTAWGIVDGVMYVLTSVFERSRYARMISYISSAPDKKAALAIIEEELETTIVQTLDEDERKRISAQVLNSASRAGTQEVNVTREDIFGAISCFFLVFLSTFPVVVPFFIIRELGIAIRISNLIAILMLFAIGYGWARYTNRNRYKAGIAMVFIGSVIVAITVALGG